MFVRSMNILSLSHSILPTPVGRAGNRDAFHPPLRREIPNSTHLIENQRRRKREGKREGKSDNVRSYILSFGTSSVTWTLASPRARSSPGKLKVNGELTFQRESRRATTASKYSRETSLCRKKKGIREVCRTEAHGKSCYSPYAYSAARRAQTAPSSAVHPPISESAVERPSSAR